MFRNRILRAFFPCLVLLPLLSSTWPCPAQDTATWPFELGNATDRAIQGLRIAIQPDAVAAEENFVIAPGEFREIRRPDARHADLRFLFDNGEYFSFSRVDFHGRKAVRAELSLAPPDIPRLMLYDDGTRMDEVIYGDSSLWKLKTVLPGFPFRPGATTLSRLKEYKAGKGVGYNSWQIEQEWDGERWKVALFFDGNAQDSVLKALVMDQAAPSPNTDARIAECLAEHAYVPFRLAADADVLNIYETAASAESEKSPDKAVSSALSEKAFNPSAKRRSAYHAPRSVFDALVRAQKDGAPLAEAFAAHAGEVIVIVQESGGLHTVIMKLAENFAQEERGQTHHRAGAR